MQLERLKATTPLGPIHSGPGITFELNKSEIGVCFTQGFLNKLILLLMGQGSILEGGISILNHRYLAGKNNRGLFKRVCSRIGYCQRSNGLISNLSILNNINLPLKYHGKEDGLDNKSDYSKKLLTELEIEKKWWDLRPADVSHEIVKKTLLARSLILQPKILLIEEPLFFLSSGHIIWLSNLLNNLKNAKIAILIETSDFPFGIAIADWFLCPKTASPKRDAKGFVDEIWIKSGNLIREEITKQWR